VHDPNHERSKEASAADKPSTQARNTTPKQSRKWFLLVGGTAILLILCIVLCAAVFTSSFTRTVTEKGDVEAVLDQFMTAMESKNAEGAYSLFSSRAKRQMRLIEIESWLSGSDFVLFEGYESLNVVALNIGPVYSTDDDQPQGTVARVSGSVKYIGGYEGGFQATLEKEAGEWKLDHIRVNAPPNKSDTRSEDD